MKYSNVRRFSIAMSMVTVPFTIASCAKAQTPATAQKVDILYEASAATPKFLLQLGDSKDYEKSTNQPYLNFAYNGSSLYTTGLAPTFSNEVESSLADVTKYGLYATAQQGSTKYGGSLLQGYNTSDLPSKIPALKGVNLVLGVNAQLQSASSSAYVFELEQARPLNFFHNLRNAFGFVVFGLGDEQLASADSAQVTQAGPTYRAEIGRQYIPDGYRDDSSLNTYYTQYFNSKYHDDSVSKQALSDLDDDRKGKANKNYDPDEVKAAQFFAEAYSAFQEHADGLSWSDFALARIKTSTKHIKDQNPLLVYWADSNGRLAIDKYVGERFRVIYTANAKVYFDPYAVNVSYLQLQFIDGFEEATPTARSKALRLLLGVSF